ncbi:hypothetical protein Tco_1150451, partial [Tanacetum coccineum]
TGLEHDLKFHLTLTMGMHLCLSCLTSRSIISTGSSTKLSLSLSQISFIGMTRDSSHKLFLETLLPVASPLLLQFLGESCTQRKVSMVLFVLPSILLLVVIVTVVIVVVISRVLRHIRTSFAGWRPESLASDRDVDVFGMHYVYWTDTDTGIIICIVISQIKTSRDRYRNNGMSDSIGDLVFLDTKVVRKLDEALDDDLDIFHGLIFRENILTKLPVSLLRFAQRTLSFYIKEVTAIAIVICYAFCGIAFCLEETLSLVEKRLRICPKSVLRSIMYVVRCTRPDVAFAQNLTIRFPQNPGELHWTAVKNILKYLRNTKDMFLVYGGNPSTELRVEFYCDAVFETDRDDTKSQTGYVFVLNGGAVDWKSSKQSTIAMSASEAAMKAVWIRKFILGLGILPTINEPLNMYCDNSAAIHYANESGVQKGVRHYHRRYHYVRECVELGEIRIL